MIWRTRSPPEPKIGLVLPGGGARAAYQVGVLRALARLLPKDAPTPFKVISGTSAGSINATALAIHADRFRRGVMHISRIWKDLRVHQVVRADTLRVSRNGAHWLAAMAFGGLGRFNPHSLLDRTPLTPLLEESLPCDRIGDAIDAGHLHALAITASNYRSGASVSFYQGHESILPWGREGRIGVPADITIDHLLASSAIPLIFPAVRLGNDYYGDGTIRQIAPMSPALHLGADRLLVVGVRQRSGGDLAGDGAMDYPTVARITGHILDSIFLDSLDTDLERLERINRTIGLIPGRRLVQNGITLRPVDVLTITPSRSIDEIAGQHAHLLPRSLRFLLRGVGAIRGHGSTLLSYLLFEKDYCRALISLGYHDAMRRRDEITRLLSRRP